MKPSVRKMLDQIDEFLSTAPCDEAGDLWDILCALRGPDHPDDAQFKNRTTVHVRAAAFPRTARMVTHNCLPAVFTPTGERMRVFDNLASGHFGAHCDYAVSAIWGSIEREEP